MQEKQAFFSLQNPFSREPNKKFDFIFYYKNGEHCTDRKCRFNLREDENIDNLKDKIASFIGKILKDKAEEEGMKYEKKIFCCSKKDVKFLFDQKEITYKMNCKRFSKVYTHLDFKLFQETYKVLVNYPKIFSLHLPKYLYVNMPVYTTLCDSVFMDKNISDCCWYKSENKTEWVFLEENYSYTPKPNDIDHFLKFSIVPKYGKKIGEVFEAVSDEKVGVFSHKCPFERRHEHIKSLQGSDFRIVSYNILSDLYDKSWYKYCPEYALTIDYRKQLILKELKGYNADIVCLQETDYKIYKTFLRPEFSKLNLSSLFNPKFKLSEGLALFYRTDKFQKIKAYSIVLGQEIRNNCGMCELLYKLQSNETILKKLINQNTVLQIIVLKSFLNEKHILIVANTHLYYHPNTNHIRLLQVIICSLYIEEILKKTSEKFPRKRISLIFCGDFNNEPMFSVFKFLTNGDISQMNEDWPENSNEIISYIKSLQNLNFGSAYGTPKYTNYTDDFKGCLDYIFYDKDKLAVKENIPLLTEAEMEENIALPSKIVPSDHMALVTDFQFII